MQKIYKDTFFSFVGLSFPILIAIFTIPTFIEELTREMFGILTIMWAVVGYFGLFDLGLGRALVYEASKNSKNSKKLEEILFAGILITSFAGIFGGLFILIISNYIQDILNFKNLDSVKVKEAFLIISFSVIFTTTTSGIRGFFEGLKKFRSSSINRVLVGSSLFLFPYLFLIFGIEEVTYFAFAIFMARFLGFIHIFILAFKYLPRKKVIKFDNIKTLFEYGSWITLSGIIGPIMIYGDRFILSNLLGLSQIPNYSVVQEIITRGLVLPASLANAILPRISESKEKMMIKSHYLFSIKRIFLMMLPISIFIILFSNQILTLWVNEEFASEMNYIFKIMSVALFFASLSQAPLIGLYGISKPKEVALIHSIELFFYIFMIFFLVNLYGIIGAAYAWTIRVIIDFFLLHFTFSLKLKNYEYKIRRSN